MKILTNALSNIISKKSSKAVISTLTDLKLAWKISENTHSKFQEVFSLKEKKLHPVSFVPISIHQDLIVFEAYINTFYLAKIALVPFHLDSSCLQHKQRNLFPDLKAWFLGDVIIEKEFMQRHGFGEQIYDYVGNYIHNELDQCFVSSHHLSDAATALWEKLLIKAKAQILYDDNGIKLYKYVPDKERT